MEKRTTKKEKSGLLTSKAGFTLVELLVVCAIFVIITAVVLARQNRFSSDIQLTNLAYQVAISIRQAQVYGLGVKGASTNFNTGYGIDFTAASPNTYQLIADNNQDKLYDQAPSPADSLVSSYQLQQGAKIDNLCVTDAYNSKTCSKGGNLTSLDIFYLRPDPSSNISANGQFSGGVSYNSASITLVSSIGDRYKCVTIYQTGQVSVNPGVGACP
ncbi:MAG TPA: type II secretion system protein [Candidatus Paceibacterota bacterium]|nr:type II secretion system protein [Candidatus Paceibacterota bacterium]